MPQRAWVAADRPFRQAAAVEPFESLSLCAEIAIAITGFSGVVLVLGDRIAARASEFDRILFRSLFTGTLIPLTIIALAFILDASNFERATIWRTCSAIQALAILAAVLLNSRSARSVVSAGANSQLLAFLRRGGAIVPIGAVLMLALAVANAMSLHSFWPVLTGVWWAIAVGLLAFLGLVFTERGE